jgi:hypothetical protein
MAIRRAKQRAQVIAKLTEVAPPGETFIACVHVESGPSPWLNSIFDEIPLLRLVVHPDPTVPLPYPDQHLGRRQLGQQVHQSPR